MSRHTFDINQVARNQPDTYSLAMVPSLVMPRAGRACLLSHEFAIGVCAIVNRQSVCQSACETNIRVFVFVVVYMCLSWRNCMHKIPVLVK
jgi:hypothetical protein